MYSAVVVFVISWHISNTYAFSQDEFDIYDNTKPDVKSEHKTLRENNHRRVKEKPVQQDEAYENEPTPETKPKNKNSYKCLMCDSCTDSELQNFDVDTCETTKGCYRYENLAFANKIALGCMMAEVQEKCDDLKPNEGECFFCYSNLCNFKRQRPSASIDAWASRPPFNEMVKVSKLKETGKFKDSKVMSCGSRVDYWNLGFLLIFVMIRIY